MVLTKEQINEIVSAYEKVSALGGVKATLEIKNDHIEITSDVRFIPFLMLDCASVLVRAGQIESYYVTTLRRKTVLILY